MQAIKETRKTIRDGINNGGSSNELEKIVEEAKKAGILPENDQAFKDADKEIQQRKTREEEAGNCDMHYAVADECKIFDVE